jgi:hypothetical protein
MPSLLAKSAPTRVFSDLITTADFCLATLKQEVSSATAELS